MSTIFRTGVRSLALFAVLLLGLSNLALAGEVVVYTAANNEIHNTMVKAFEAKLPGHQGQGRQHVNRPNH